MRFRPALVVTALLALAPAAHAQDFGVLESAETINQGNFKFGVFPLFVLPDEGDTAGLDLSVIASAPVASSIEAIGALDTAFNDGFTTVHLVPGVEIAMTPDLDFLAEFGFGVTNSSSHYLGFGLAFYLR